MRQYEYIKTKDSSMLSYVGLHRDGHYMNIILADAIDPTEALENIDFSEINIYNRGDVLLATYTQYTTVYRYNGNLLQLSDDGSVYIEPKPYQYVKINGGDGLNVESATLDEHVLSIMFAEDVDVEHLNLANPTPIVLYSVYDEVLQTYTGFVDIYRINGHLVQLSDDGSEYDPEEQHQKEIVAARNAKIGELSAICNTMINAGVDVEIDGNQKHFSFTSEDQQNLKAAFDLSAATKMSVPYHADNDTCTLFTPEQVAQIYIAEQLNLTHHQTYFNQLKQMILAMDDIEDIDAVVYGRELIGQYLQTYQAMMAQTQAIINAMINS